MFQTKASKLILLSVIFVVFSFIGWYVIQILEKNKKSYYLSIQSALLQAKFDTSYNNYLIMSNDIFSMYAKNEKMIELFSKAKDANETQRVIIRQNIYDSLSKNYKRLNNMGISQVHFHLPSNISFLRMYKPSKFGDDLSQTRHSVSLANKLKIPQEGFETCKFISGFRFIYPVFNAQDEHIGSIGISYEGKQLLHSIIDNFVYDSHILVLKEVIDTSIKDEQLKVSYKNSWEAKDYYLDSYVHKSVGNLDLYNKINSLKLQEEIEEGIHTKKTFSIATRYNYKNIILTFLPIKNALGVKNISYIVTYTESDYLSNIQTEENYIELMYLIVLVLLYLFGIYVIYSQEKLKVLALFDMLTGLPNRTLFTIEFQNEINRAMRYENKLAVIFLDLDGFKAVNDTYGHHVGDLLLKKISNIITSKIRKSDLAARLGGDEFIILLTDIKDNETVMEITQNIINDINKDILIEKEPIHVGASIGISIFPDDAGDSQTLIKYADKMMYKSKKNGKNQATLYKKEENINV